MIGQELEFTIDENVGSHEMVSHRTWRSVYYREAADHSGISQDHHLLITWYPAFGVVGLTGLNPFCPLDGVGLSVYQAGVVVYPNKILREEIFQKWRIRGQKSLFPADVQVQEFFFRRCLCLR